MKVVHQLTLLSLVGAAVILTILLFRRPSESRVYDRAEAIRKLTAIGRALQIYREEYGFKPAHERRSPADAGLPELLVLLTKPGYMWSLPDGEASFRVSSPNDLYVDAQTHFVQMYWSENIVAQGKHRSMAGQFSERAENLPILIDYNPSTMHQMMYDDSYRVLVLRLNSSVDEVALPKEKRE